jgi:hypothetical protein
MRLRRERVGKDLLRENEGWEFVTWQIHSQHCTAVFVHSPSSFPRNHRDRISLFVTIVLRNLKRAKILKCSKERIMCKCALKTLGTSPRNVRALNLESKHQCLFFLHRIRNQTQANIFSENVLRHQTL